MSTQARASGSIQPDSLSLTTETLRIPRVLSLDGGGVRGLSSLLILREMMNELSPQAQAPKPCEYFDLIGGTSTGGLIAIMLGALGMVTRYHEGNF
jgi:patatin-like phospholipase/acyl hydrolase